MLAVQLFPAATAGGAAIAAAAHIGAATSSAAGAREATRGAAAAQKGSACSWAWSWACSCADAILALAKLGGGAAPRATTWWVRASSWVGGAQVAVIGVDAAPTESGSSPLQGVRGVVVAAGALAFPHATAAMSIVKPGAAPSVASAASAAAFHHSPKCRGHNYGRMRLGPGGRRCVRGRWWRAWVGGCAGSRAPVGLVAGDGNIMIGPLLRDAVFEVGGARQSARVYNHVHVWAVCPSRSIPTGCCRQAGGRLER